MSKTPKFIPHSVVNQLFNLSVAQVQAVLEQGGNNYTKLSSVTCLGQQPNGHMVYSCTGENILDHVRIVKIKVSIDPKWDASVKPEFREARSKRVLDGVFVMSWA